MKAYDKLLEIYGEFFPDSNVTEFFILFVIGCILFIILMIGKMHEKG